MANLVSGIFFPVIIYSCVNLEHHTYRKLISEMLGCFGDVFCVRVRGFWADFEGELRGKTLLYLATLPLAASCLGREGGRVGGQSTPSTEFHGMV